MPGSTTSSAQGTAVTKVNIPAADYARIEKIRDITKEELDNFPTLIKGPDALYWLMATFGAESGWRLFHGKTPNKSSRHLTPALPAKSRLSRVGYYNSNVIQNVVKDPTVSLEQIVAIEDGFYAHGITACMGSYHVRGCPNNLDEWRKYPEAVARITALGLEVDPGISITQTLFPTDDETSWRRSIVSGIIIFNSKYKEGLVKKAGDTGKAMQYALGAYLGKEGLRDANRVSPDDRRRDLTTNQGRASLLKYVGVVRQGDDSKLTNYAVNLGDKEAKGGGSTTVNNNPSSFVATTTASSQGKSKGLPGCEVT